MKRARKILNWLSKYRAWRCAVYFVIYVLIVPPRYALILLRDLVIAVLETFIVTTDEELVSEFVTLAYVIRREFKSDEHDG